jgi:hypothetical protein
MTLTIDATIGGVNSNSYITIARATEIADYDIIERVDWYVANADDKIRALVSATRQLDTLPWVGLRATTTQALAWPRTDAVINGREISATEIPQEIQQATYDLPSNRTSNYSALITRAPSLSTVLYGTLSTFGTGGSGLLVGVVRS